jgi:hypothetical protein
MVNCPLLPVSTGVHEEGEQMPWIAATDTLAPEIGPNGGNEDSTVPVATANPPEGVALSDGTLGGERSAWDAAGGVESYIFASAAIEVLA